MYHKIQEDHPHFDPPSLLRDRVESLYEICHKLVDKKFPFQIKYDFAACYSELYFCTTFMKRLGINVSHPSDKGPDYYLQSLDCWAEIVTISKGDKSKSNSISKPEPGMAGDGFADENKIILRITSSFLEKADKIQTYIKNGLIKSSQRIIICISGGWIDPCVRLQSYLEGSFPAVVKALLPIGNLVLLLNRDNMTVDGITSQYRDHVTKENQNKEEATIRTDYFIDPKYRFISGVLFSNANITDSIEDSVLGRTSS